MGTLKRDYLKGILCLFIIFNSLWEENLMTTLKVTCTVTNCVFHDIKNICGAEKIEINMHNPTFNDTSSEFSADFDVLAAAANSTQTCCNTFKPKKNHPSPKSS